MIKTVYRIFILKGWLNRFKRKNIDNSKWVLFTVAFNKPELVELQFKNLTKFVDAQYVIVDNSTIQAESEKIKMYSKKNNITYFRLPGNPFPSDPSSSHGSSLNWIWVNIIKPRKITKLGFLDHDIFPVSKCSIDKMIGNQSFYGLKQTRDDKWYLWPGFSFFKIKNYSNDINFLPANGLDTGGQLWGIIYPKDNLNKLKFAKRKYIKTGNSNNPQESFMEIFDSTWLHMINGSNWAKVKQHDKKLDILISKLDKL